MSEACGFFWTSRDGREHSCRREHWNPGAVMHVCSCGSSIYPGRIHPEKHLARVSEASRRRNERSLATAVRRNQIWAPEEDLKLLELLWTQDSLDQVARLLGRTVNGVRGRCRKLGAHLRPRNTSEGVAPAGSDR